LQNAESSLPKDIIDKVYQDYEINLVENALSIINEFFTESKSIRVVRCAIFLAGGNLNNLQFYLEKAKQDYRDLIYWAEYDKFDKKIRDFNMPFV
jgi:uncharacterized protein YpuA (DUF1002 family)